MASMKERMTAGELYLASDPELVKGRARAYQLNQELSQHFIDDTQRKRITHELLGACDETTFIQPPFFCDYGYNIKVGKNFYINAFGTILDGAPVTIGDNVMMGPQVQIYTAGHPLDPAERSTLWEFSKPIRIESDVWLGGGVVVLGGVTIGEGSTVAAGSVITKDVPPYVVVAGNPAKVIKTLPRPGEDNSETV
ncbi:hypothetical protein IWQ61_004218 [Dispira simplex]|nr:hypothetical protein IWQ61_004218 [Dispira simplex]